MCIIIINQKGTRLPKSVLKKSARINPHGLGIVWLDDYSVTYHLSTEWPKLQADRPFIAHFRYATVGEISEQNTHPFVCGKRKDELLMQNGTIKGYGNKSMTDTEMLAIELGNMPRERWASKLTSFDSRFVSINTRTKSFQIYNKHLWVQHDGVWYSKGNVLERNLVAVYGTLKMGHGNYYNYLNTSTYVGRGETTDKYPLVVNGLPYLLEHKGDGDNVTVDVFRVSDDVLRNLDSLEGHPNWYIRKKISINVNDKAINCWVYFCPSAERYYNGYNWVKSFEERVRVRSSYVPRYTYLDVKPRAKKNPICINCYNDLQYDGHSSYLCNACGEWFTEREANELTYINN